MMFIWPLHDHIVTRGFAYFSSIYVGGMHAAIDLIRKTGATRAAPIMAAAGGAVAGVGWDYYSGFFVAVDHAGGFRSFYRHLYGQTPVVVGQQVSQGQIIGNVGNTGAASLGDHLHFDLWNRGKVRDDGAIFFKNGWYAVDPALYLGLEDDMGMTPDETARLEKLEGDLSGAYSQLAWLRSELGLPPEFDPAQAHESALYRYVKWLVDHANDANYHHNPSEIQDIVGSGGGYTDQRAVRAVKDALPG